MLRGFGGVVLAEAVNVWTGAVLRGDVERIDLGAWTSFQDNAVAHVVVVHGAGSLVIQGNRFPPRSLIAGSPARVVRQAIDLSPCRR